MSYHPSVTHSRIAMVVWPAAPLTSAVFTAALPFTGSASVQTKSKCGGSRKLLSGNRSTTHALTSSTTAADADGAADGAGLALVLGGGVDALAADAPSSPKIPRRPMKKK